MPGVSTSLKYGDSILDIIVLVEILKFWAPQSITTQIRLFSHKNPNKNTIKKSQQYLRIVKKLFCPY